MFNTAKLMCNHNQTIWPEGQLPGSFGGVYESVNNFAMSGYIAQG